jgi:hypothetical protein
MIGIMATLIMIDIALIAHTIHTITKGVNYVL